MPARKSMGGSKRQQAEGSSRTKSFFGGIVKTAQDLRQQLEQTRVELVSVRASDGRGAAQKASTPKLDTP